jgi:hypothetical protein
MSNIKSIIKKRITNETLWNLAVEDDESYIANGVIVHNCRSILIPITRFEDWQADYVTNSGKNVDKFLQENVVDKGFSIYSHNPQITDRGVNISTDFPDEVTEVFTYSLEEGPFQTTTVVYKDKDKKEIKSLVHKRLERAKV